MDASTSSEGNRRLPHKRATQKQDPALSTSFTPAKKPRNSRSTKKTVKTTPSSADDGDSTEAEEIHPKYITDRWKRLQELRVELKHIARKVFNECKVSGPRDDNLTGKVGILLECLPPHPWLFDDETGYDTNEEDDRSPDDNSTATPPASESDQDDPAYLFLDARTLLAAECGALERTSDSCMEPVIVKLLNTIFADAARIDDSGGGHRRKPFKCVRECDLKDYKFEAVAYLVNDFLLCGRDKTCVHNASQASVPVKPTSSGSKRRSSPSRGRGRSKTSCSPVSSQNTADSQQHKLLKYIDAYDLGQNWWAPYNYADYTEQLKNVRIYPRAAQSVYDLARSFGRVKLYTDSVDPMLWHWGCEVKVNLWSLPDFSFFWSKFNLAGICGDPALHNFLLVLLEKKFPALNEALALYDQVAKSRITPIATMYVERELTSWQTRNAYDLEWILSTIEKEKPDSPIYSKTLANSILLRAACTARGKAMLERAIAPNYDGPLETNNDRYRRLLWIAQLKARFTLDLSAASVPNEPLRKVLRAAANKASAMANNSDAGTSRASISAASSVAAAAENDAVDDEVPIPPVTITFHLYRSNIEFAKELAKALQIIHSPGEKRPKGKEFTRLSEDNCATIDWQKVEIKQMPYDESDLPVPYEKAQEFHPLPFVYMPNEEQLLVRAFRRLMPLHHPMLMMLLHTLYDNDHTNLIADEVAGEEDGGSSSGSESCDNRPVPHYHLRLTAENVEMMFGCHFKWQKSKLGADSAENDV